MTHEADTWDAITFIKQYFIDQLKATDVRQEDPPNAPTGFDLEATWLKVTMPDGSRHWFGVTYEFLKCCASEPSGLRRTLDVQDVITTVREAKQPVLLGHEGWLDS